MQRKTLTVEKFNLQNSCMQESQVDGILTALKVFCWWLKWISVTKLLMFLFNFATLNALYVEHMKGTKIIFIVDFNREREEFDQNGARGAMLVKMAG